MTTEEKNKFFDSLANFAITDEQFFREQYADLQPREKKAFDEWLLTRNQNLHVMKSLVDTIQKLLEEKHKTKNNG